MIKINYAGLAVLSAFFLFLFIQCSNETVFFVSPDGNDTNPGTEKEPVATIEKARDLARSAEKKGQNIKIFLKGGQYNISHTIAFDHQDSGTVQQPLEIHNYNDEEVVINGGVILNSSDFKSLDDPEILNRIVDDKAKKKILALDLKSYGITDYGMFRQHGFSTAILPTQMELFINHQPMTVARWPNEGIVPITEVIDEGAIPYEHDFSGKGGTIKFNYDRAKYWKKADNIWLWGYFGAGYADDNLGVETIDFSKKIIKLKHSSMFGIKKSDPDDEWAGRIIGYHAYNLLEEIDMPGEYFIDHQTGILYLYPPENFEKSEISVSVMDEPLMAIENTSNIKISGITFEYGRGMGVYLEGGHDVVFKNCTFRNFGTIALMMGKGIGEPDYPIHEMTGQLVSRRVGNLKAHNYENSDFNNNAGKYHSIMHCKMYNLGSGGMVLSGGDRKMLIRGNNKVENTEIYDYNRRNKTYCAGITLFGVGNIIRHCFIHDAPHQAIALFGNEHIIEYNHIKDAVQYVNDMGAICIGRNPSERGNIIRHNFFDNMGTDGFKNCAVMLDDGTSDVLIEGNVFYKCSRFNFGNITFNGGCDNVVRNNIFIEGAHTIWIEDRKLSMPDTAQFNKTYTSKGLWGKRLFKDINMNSAAWKQKYPDFDPFYENGEAKFLKNLEFYNNVIVREELFVSKHNLDSTAFAVWKNNYVTNEDPGFVNYKEKDFNLKDDSEVFKKIPDFEKIPFDSMGIVDMN